MKKLSVVIPTRREEANIANCIRAFDRFRDDVEIIVVDNSSDNLTKEIALSFGVKVFDQGPERCAQRNRGWRESVARHVMFVDADMIVEEDTIREILSYVEQDVEALYVREVRVGETLRVKARNYERSFYDGTVIDALRVIRRDYLERVGGYDENLTACEDWDLDRRLFLSGIKSSVTRGHLLHNEAKQSLKTLLSKKAYYSTSIERYREKWRGDKAMMRQFSPCYRYFGVFVEDGKWVKVIRHPVLFAVMMLERVAIGIVYLLNR